MKRSRTDIKKSKTMNHPSACQDARLLNLFIARDFCFVMQQKSDIYPLHSSAKLNMFIRLLFCKSHTFPPPKLVYFRQHLTSKLILQAAVNDVCQGAGIFKENCCLHHRRIRE